MENRILLVTDRLVTFLSLSVQVGLKKVPVLQIMFDQCDDPPNLLCQQNKHRAL